MIAYDAFVFFCFKLQNFVDAKDFHPDYVFLTGSPTQVQDMAKKYRVYVSKAEETDDGDYLVDHSIVVYFHDDKGELSDCFTQSMRPKDISEKIIEKMTTPEGLVA
jgi:protein SCO1/2